MYKKIFSYLKPYKKETFLACLFVVLETLLEIVIPFLMNYILQNNGGINYGEDNIITNVNYKVVYAIGIAMIVSAILAFILGVLGSKYTAIAGRGLGANLRKEQFKKIQNFSFNNLDHFRNDSLITRLTNDITIIQDWFCQSLRATLRSPTLLLFSLILAFIVSPYLGIIFLVAVPFLSLLIILILKYVKPKFISLQKTIDDLNRVTDESIIAIKTVKSYVKEDYEMEKFQNVNSDLIKTSSSAFSAISMNLPAIQFVMYATIIALLTFGASFFEKGLIKDVSEISTFLSYILQLLAVLIMMSNVFILTNRANASIIRVIDVLKTQSEIIDGNDDKKINSGNININKVNFKYNKKSKNYVLENINMNIHNGDFIGIFGQTGSGKTTLINLIERFYDVTDGEIIIDNLNIKNYKLYELHNKIAVCFQNPILFSGTILDNLKWGNKNASIEEIKKVCKIACCYDFINNQLPQGYNTMISQGGTNLSGGQRQRICIARALLKNPKILILDDSFSALDHLTEEALKSNLNELKSITKIIISQKISAIKDANDIYVLVNGKISHHGSHNELLKQDEIYSNTYNIQNEGNLG